MSSGGLTMKNSKLILIVALLIGMVGVAPTASAQQTFAVSPSSEDSADYKADVQAILDFNQTVFDAQIAGAIQAWLISFAEDVTLMPPNAPALTNKLANRQ
jgi:hypothetical protein